MLESRLRISAIMLRRITGITKPENLSWFVLYLLVGTLIHQCSFFFASTSPIIYDTLSVLPEEGREMGAFETQAKGVKIDVDLHVRSLRVSSPGRE